MHGRLVLQENLHPDEGLAALLSEHVPGLRSGQQVRHGALGESQDRLPEQSLADAVLAEQFLCLPGEIVRVEVGVLIELKERTLVTCSRANNKTSTHAECYVSEVGRCHCGAS